MRVCHQILVPASRRIPRRAASTASSTSPSSRTHKWKSKRSGALNEICQNLLSLSASASETALTATATSERDPELESQHQLFEIYRGTVRIRRHVLSTMRQTDVEIEQSSLFSELTLIWLDGLDEQGFGD